MMIHLKMIMNMSITRPLRPLLMHTRHVDLVSDLPSSGVAFVNAAGVSDTRLDSVNIEKDGSSSLAPSAPMTVVTSDSVVVSTEKVVENVIPG
jgi:hypothetical protein